MTITRSVLAATQGANTPKDVGFLGTSWASDGHSVLAPPRWTVNDFINAIKRRGLTHRANPIVQTASRHIPSSSHHLKKQGTTVNDISRRAGE